MKKLLWMNLGALLATVLIIGGPARASEGGVDSGGGDLAQIRERRIRTLFSQLREDLLYFTDSVTPGDLQEPVSREIYEGLLAQGLREDIRTSSYELRERCQDRDGVERSATAGVNDRGGAICLNLPMLVNGAATERDIYSLIIHEHAHHLGIADEEQAYQAGQALSGPIAAKLYYSPRPGRAPVLVPVPNQGTCLNFRHVTERFASMDPDTRTWQVLSDIRIPKDASPWFRAYMVWMLGAGPYEDPLKNFWRTSVFYQNECRSLLVPAGENRYEETPIISYSPTHIEVGGYSGLGSIIIRMPEGESGSRMVWEMSAEIEGQLKCEDETKSMKEEKQVTYTYQFVLGARTPERVTVGARVLRELSQVPGIMNDLAHTHPGCTFSNERSNSAPSE